LLDVELFAFTNSDGSPERPMAYVQPSTAYGGGADMTPDGLRELARRVHTHAAAIEALADQLADLRH
jgi:hypothetical protein